MTSLTDICEVTPQYNFVKSKLISASRLVKMTLCCGSSGKQVNVIHSRCEHTTQHNNTTHADKVIFIIFKKEKKT